MTHGDAFTRVFGRYCAGFVMPASRHAQRQPDGHRLPPTNESKVLYNWLDAVRFVNHIHVHLSDHTGVVIALDLPVTGRTI